MGQRTEANRGRGRKSGKIEGIDFSLPPPPKKELRVYQALNLVPGACDDLFRLNYFPACDRLPKLKFRSESQRNFRTVYEWPITLN